MNSKTLSIVLSVAVIVLLGVVGYLLFWPKVSVAPIDLTSNQPATNQSQNELAGWNTYTNTKYGFEIKYPESYQVSNTTSTSVAPSLESSYARIDFTDMQSSAISYTGKAITVDGVTAVELPLGGNMDGGIEFEIGFNKFPATQDKFRILFSTKTGGYDSKIDEFRQILSTFKFTKQTSAKVTADWKTYTNSQFNFSYQYPKDYKVSENCSQVYAKPTCNVTIQNSSSRFIVVVNNPGSGWFGVKNSEDGTMSIGGIKTSYQFGQEVNTGGEITDGPWIFLATFTKSQNEYNLAFEYSDAHPGVFLEEVIKPLLSTFKFTK